MNLSERIITRWADTDPDELIELTKEVIKKSIETNNKINNIKDLANDINDLQTYHSVCGFLQYVSPNDKLRKASIKCDLMIVKHINELDLRKDIYLKLLEIKNSKLNSEDSMFVNSLILNYERNGINLDKEQRDVLLKIKHEISKLENGIANFICDADKGTLEIGNTKIKTNKNNYGLQMKQNKNSEERKKVELRYSNLCSGTLMSYIAKLIVLRDKHAKILSYKCHSDYKAFIQMTKNSNNIKNFMAELLSKLNYRYMREIDTISKFKDKNINSYDIQYYVTKWKQEYGINENKLKEYFEFNNTINEIFKIYEKLFGISFVKLNNKVWHNSVVLYGIFKEQELLGYLYLDLFSRELKYKQTRCFCLKPAIVDQIPSVVMLSSIGEKSDINLINFQDVISLFHEMAHVMHHIFGKTKYAIFSGVNVEVDFVETPAQILDLLCWEKDIIKRLSHHYQTGESLGDDTINKLIKLKNIDIGIYYKRHILIALYDQMIYSSQSVIDSFENALKEGNEKKISNVLSDLYRQLHNEIMIDKDKNPKYKIELAKDIGVPYEWLSTFLGSDSQYYSSIWSRVLSADVYNEMIKGKPINSDIGDQLVKHIFQHGGTKQGYEMICNYMKRAPEIDGFISMHDLDRDMEYSFFLNTDQIKMPKTEQFNINSTEANKFSEINESAVYVTDIEKV